MTLTPHELNTARQICTPRQLDVLTLHNRGFSLRMIAAYLDLDHTTVRGHLRAARRRIAQHAERTAA